jgi:hypothetical protein
MDMSFMKLLFFLIPPNNKKQHRSGYAHSHGGQTAQAPQTEVAGFL